MKTDDILLYLYRDVGLYWEKELSLEKNKSRVSLQSNKLLKKFLSDNEIVYNITNSKYIKNQDCRLNEFYMTASYSTRVGSLLKHLRNSIMHGHYQIMGVDGKLEIMFEDFHNKKSTMKGKVQWEKLVQLIECTK